MTAQSDSRWLFVGAYAAALITVIYGLVDGNFVMPVSQSAMAIAFGLVIGMTPAVTGSRPPVSAAVIAALLTALATVLTSWEAERKVASQNQEIKAFLARKEQSWLAPRFWQQGLMWRQWPATPRLP